MKLSAGSRSALKRRVDGAYPPETSVVCRYRHAVRLDDRAGRDRAIKRILPDACIREGARVVPFPTYRGVDVHILDETSAMETGSIKAIDGCLTTALCRVDGVARIAFESGGNTGSALTRYGRNAGLETFFFCPSENLDLLDGALFDGRRAHLIGVGDRGRVKELAALFAKAAGIRRVPDRTWRYASGMFRGLHIAERMLAGAAFDWISQTISAAFGPIGIYKVLEAFRADIRPMPRFLGLQQEANCPMFRAWNPAAARRLARPARARGRLLSRIMYDEIPDSYDTWRDLRRLLERTRGDLLTVNDEEFDSRLRPSAPGGPVLDLLRSEGISISLRSGQVLERTGLVALVGTLKAIDAGVIPKGARVLCCLTGGVTGADGRAKPERTVRGVRDARGYAEAVREGR